MNRAGVGKITAAAWDERPTWRENLTLAAVGGVAWLLFDLSWWTLLVVYVAGCTSFCILFGWLEVINEAAEQAELAQTETPPEREDGAG